MAERFVKVLLACHLLVEEPGLKALRPGEEQHQREPAKEELAPLLLARLPRDCVLESLQVSAASTILAICQVHTVLYCGLLGLVCPRNRAATQNPGPSGITALLGFRL